MTAPATPVPSPSSSGSLSASPSGMVLPMGPRAAPGAGLALALLLAINLFNYVDRQVLAAVEPRIRDHFFPQTLDAVSGTMKEPENAKFWMGMLSTAFLVTYMLTAPLFGWLANRMSRWVLIGIGVLIWSLASGGSGLAPIFAVMILTRCLVGIGEAVYGPVAPDMISDLFPVRMRGLVLSAFYTAIPFGGALGYIIGAEVSRGTGDWRIPFYVVTIPGLLLGGWCFFMREPRRGQCEENAGTPIVGMNDLTPGQAADFFALLADKTRGMTPEGKAYYLCHFRDARHLVAFTAWQDGQWFEACQNDWQAGHFYNLRGIYGVHEHSGPQLNELLNIQPAPVEQRKERLVDYLILLRTPSYVLNTLGMTAMTFAMGGLAFWVAGYLQYRGVATLWGIDAVTAFGGLTALTGLAATVLGGLAGDWLRPYFSGSYFLVSGAAMILAFPMLLLMIWLPFPWAWIPLVFFVFFLFFNTGPTNTILANVTHPLLRAPGFALNILVIHLLGDAASPPLMGKIAGAFPPGQRSFLGLHDLDVSFFLVSIMVLLGGILWLWGTHYLERDTRRAPLSLPPDPPPLTPAEGPS
jgi:MFS transporter, Spinster family, sphingosine-1-phosphate transporter